MKNKLLILTVIILTCFSLLNLVNTNQTRVQLDDLKNTVKENPSKIVYVQAKDGKTPIKGIDYFDGANGINAVSFTTQTTVVKEVPLIGEKGDAGKDGVDGKDGLDSPRFITRTNEDTGDLEYRYSDDKFWSVLVPCYKFVNGCNNG